jgi:hypothetical protein
MQNKLGSSVLHFEAASQNISINPFQALPSWSFWWSLKRSTISFINSGIFISAFIIPSDDLGGEKKEKSVESQFALFN